MIASGVDRSEAIDRMGYCLEHFVVTGIDTNIPFLQWILNHPITSKGKPIPEEVLKEVVQIRKELGYPIMVTPFSQFVVSQAAMNIMVGERYKQVSDEVIKYTLGFWGKEASSLVEPNIKDKILSLPRAKELLNWESPQPSLKEIREKLGGLGVSDDELLLRFLIQEEEIRAMRSVAGSVREYFTARNPVVELIHELCKQKNSNYISIQKKIFHSPFREKQRPDYETEMRYIVGIGIGCTSVLI